MDLPQGDLARVKAQEPDQSWPTEVKVQLFWTINGRVHIRSIHIDADAFFGNGSHGAPMSGDRLIGQIENMRRQGPPDVPARKTQNAKKKR